MGVRVASTPAGQTLSMRRSDFDHRDATERRGGSLKGPSRFDEGMGEVRRCA